MSQAETCAKKVRSRCVGPRWLAFMIGAALCVGVAVPAEAGLFDYTATLDLNVGTVDTFQLEASGQITVEPNGSFILPAAVLATTRTLIPLQTTSEAVASIDLQLANGAGSFRGPLNPGGVMSLNGQAVLNLQPFLGFPSLTVGISPIGGTGMSTGVVSNGSTQLTAAITGAEWQLGVFQQVGVTASASTFTPRTITGLDLRTSGGEGVVTYVVPAYITTRVDGAFSERSPISGVLSITFVPEPSLLIGLGSALLLLLGFRRLGQRRPGSTESGGSGTQ